MSTNLNVVVHSQITDCLSIRIPVFAVIIESFGNIVSVSVESLIKNCDVGNIK